MAQLELDLSIPPALPKLGTWVECNHGVCRVYWAGGKGSVMVEVSGTLALFADWWKPAELSGQFCEIKQTVPLC